MKKIFVLLLLVVSFSAIAQRQSLALSWLNSAQLYNGGRLTSQSIAECSDGSIVSTGSLSGSVDMDPGQNIFLLSTKFPLNEDVSDAFIAKYSRKGELLFAVSTQDSSESSTVFAYSITVDKDDNIYVTGGFTGTVTFSSASLSVNLRAVNGSRDNFLACYSKNGILKFAEDITQTRERKYCFAYSVAVDTSKNIYVTGYFRGTNVDFDPGPGNVYLTAETQDIFFSKYDSLGNLAFVKNMGGDGDDYTYKIGVDHKGNILLTGNFYSSSVDFDPNAGQQILTRKGYADIFIAKYDNNGNYLFAKNIGKLKSDYPDGLSIAADNSFVITGSFYGKGVDFDPGNGGRHILSTLSSSGEAFIARYDTAGNCKLAFAMQSKDGDFTNGTDIGLDSTGNIFSIGQFSGKGVDFDPGPDSFFIKNAKYFTNYITKYDSTGKLLLAEAIGNYDTSAETYAYLRALDVLREGNIAVAGNYGGSIDLDPKKDTVLVTCPSFTFFIGRYDYKGSYSSSINPQTDVLYYNSIASISASATDAEGNVYAFGNFDGRFDFDPGPEVYTVESLADYRNSTFMAKYTHSGTLVFAKTIISNIRINDVAIDSNENFYITGAASGTSDLDPSDSVHYFEHDDSIKPQNAYGFFFAKYSKDGDFIFAKGGGQSSNINSNAIALDKYKNIYIAGVFPGKLDFDPGPGSHILNGYGDNVFYAKYDSAGNYIFANKLGDSQSGGEMKHLRLDSKANLIMSGTFYGDSLDADPGIGVYYLNKGKALGSMEFVGKYKSNGDFLKAFSFPVLDNKAYTTDISSLVVDKTDNLYIAGGSYGKVDFDPGPKNILLPSPQGGYFASYNPQGQLRYLKGIPAFRPSSGGSNLTGIALDKKNNIYLGGSFTSIDIDCDPGPDTALLINENYSEVPDALFIAKYDNLGNYIYGYDFDADSVQGYNSITGIAVDGNGAVNCTGDFESKINFGVNGQHAYLSPTARYGNLFLAQYLPVIQQTNTNKTNLANVLIPAVNEQVKVYPNPVRDKVIVSLTQSDIENTKAIIQLLDIKGNCVLTQPSSISNHQMQQVVNMPPALPVGNYMLKITVNGRIYYSKRLLKL